MKSYKYVARDTSGSRKEGVGQAVSSSDILTWLREQGFTPISVDEISEGIKQVRQTSSYGRIKSSDLAAMSWQLTTMVEGGIPVIAALDTIAEDIENFQLQYMLGQISEKMKKGETFADSLAEFPSVFNKLSCAIILAGEASGTLATALSRLAQYFDDRDKLAKKLKGAMTYPAFVVFFIILIVIFIMTFIVPRFTLMFEQFGSELPAFTRGFMAVYDFLRHNVIYIVGTVALLVTSGVLSYTKTKEGHYFFSKLVLNAPLFGKLIKHTFIAMFCRTVSTLLSSGVSVLEVFDIISAMASNDVIKDAIECSKKRVVEGSNISASMASTQFFPNMVVKMIQVGEESGSLSSVLERTADYYERKVDSTIDIMMSLLEPVMIVTVGGIVLVVILALYLPIFSMSG
ncbi:MAG: type II secretion system F family protein [Planctomycetes bacterium]|nr:type II secretion system F family protein [Planctomycetota bacterium]